MWVSACSRNCPPPPISGTLGGGIGNALIGTFVVVAIATAMSVPIGILAAIFLAEIGPDTRTATVVRFATKVLTGLPSILAGVFAYAAVVVLTGTFSAPAGGVALAVLMLPTIVLTAEEAIRMVPHRMKEAAIGMGATRTQMILQVMLPTARPGLLTGIMLAVARAAGETAPLHFHDSFQRLLAEPSHGADAVHGRADLRLFQFALSEPDRHGLGRFAGAGDHGADHEHR